MPLESIKKLPFFGTQYACIYTVLQLQGEPMYTTLYSKHEEKLVPVKFFSHLPLSEQPIAHNTHLKLNVMGPLAFSLNGLPLPVSSIVKRRKIQDLLILLILNRKQGLPKKVIFDLFWDHYSESSKKDNLKTLIYRLKKLLGSTHDILVVDRNTVYLNMEYVQLDIDTFTEGIQTIEGMGECTSPKELLDYTLQVLQLYRGEFLETISTDVPIDREKTMYQHSYQKLLFQTIKLCVYNGMYHESLELGKKLLAVDPYCEPAYRLLMTSLGFLGNTSEIVRLYQSLERKLFTAFAIQPDEKTLMLKNKLILGVYPAREESMDEVSMFH